MKRTIIVFICLFGLACTGTLVSQESGGTTGADFLLSPPASRTDAMGGVLDGLGISLDGVHFNPAVLAPIDSIVLQLDLRPLPNEVTHTQLAFGVPIFGGLAAVSAQMFNTGGFTYINESGQAAETETVLDAAVSLGYSRDVWRTVSAGINLKGIYRILGEYSAVAVGTDLGAAYRFETPHFGQRPKPPTENQIRKEYEQEKKGIDAEKEKRIQAVSGEMADLQKQVDGKQKALEDLDGKIASAKPDKLEDFQQDRKETETELTQLQQDLTEMAEQNKDSLQEIEDWYSNRLADAEAGMNKKLSDLLWIDKERARLFRLLDDPSVDLTADIIEQNIAQSIEKIQFFQIESTAGAVDRNNKFEERRRGRITEIEADIAEYQSTIDSEVGPESQRINSELESLKSRRASLAEAGDDESKAQVKVLDKQIGEKEKELANLITDPWLKRLQDRIDAKTDEIADTEAEITAMDEATHQVMEDITARAGQDVDRFEELSAELKKELRKLQLKKELDLLNAGRESAVEKAVRVYKEKEKALYLRLLDAMYSHEEKNIQSNIEAVKEDAEARRYDFETEMSKSKERLDNDIVFQRRLINNQIAKTKREQAEKDSPEITALSEEFKEKEAAYQEKVKELDQSMKDFEVRQKSELDAALTDLLYQRKLFRLVYLQTDKPYLNTSANVALRNFGTAVKFVEESAPLPAMLSVGLGYALLNIENHNVKLSTQLNVPFHDDISVGVGVEYVFADLAYGPARK